MLNALINVLLKMQNQYRIYHWQTESYAQHMAYGGMYDTLSDLIDSFIEAYIGKYGRALDLHPTLELNDFSSDGVQITIDEGIKFLESLNTVLDAKDTDLLNMRDEMLAAHHKLKYLLTLK